MLGLDKASTVKEQLLKLIKLDEIVKDYQPTMRYDYYYENELFENGKLIVFSVYDNALTNLDEGLIEQFYKECQLPEKEKYDQEDHINLCKCGALRKLVNYERNELEILITNFFEMNKIQDKLNSLNGQLTHLKLVTEEFNLPMDPLDESIDYISGQNEKNNSEEINQNRSIETISPKKIKNKRISKVANGETEWSISVNLQTDHKDKRVYFKITGRDKYRFEKIFTKLPFQLDYYQKLFYFLQVNKGYNEKNLRLFVLREFLGMNSTVIKEILDLGTTTRHISKVHNKIKARIDLWTELFQFSCGGCTYCCDKNSMLLN